MHLSWKECCFIPTIQAQYGMQQNVWSQKYSEMRQCLSNCWNDVLRFGLMCSSTSYTSCQYYFLFIFGPWSFRLFLQLLKIQVITKQQILWLIHWYILVSPIRLYIPLQFLYLKWSWEIPSTLLALSVNNNKKMGTLRPEPKKTSTIKHAVLYKKPEFTELIMLTSANRTDGHEEI